MSQTKKKYIDVGGKAVTEYEVSTPYKILVYRMNGFTSLATTVHKYNARLRMQQKQSQYFSAGVTRTPDNTGFNLFHGLLIEPYDKY